MPHSPSAELAPPMTAASDRCTNEWQTIEAEERWRHVHGKTCRLRRYPRAMLAWMNGPTTEPMVSLCGEFGAGGKDVADEFFPSLTARGIVP